MRLDDILELLFGPFDDVNLSSVDGKCLRSYKPNAAASTSDQSNLPFQQTARLMQCQQGDISPILPCP